MTDLLISVNSSFANSAPKNRAALLGLLLVLELLLTSISFDAEPLSKIDLPIFKMLGSTRDFLRVAITFSAVFFVLNLPRLKTVLLPFKQLKQHPFALRWLSLHFFVLACFWLLCFLLFSSAFVLHSNNAILVSVIAAAWFLIGCCSLICLLLVVAPLAVWLEFCCLEKVNFALALVVGGFSWGLSVLAANSWNVLAGLTFKMTEWVLSLFYANVVANLDEKTLRIGDFQVQIGVPCSGYEGIGLVIIFLTLYLYLARQQLRFPQALLLYPIGIAFIWLFNVLRISLLIILGSVWSPEIATGGFHSNAGWIAFVIISSGIVFLAQRLTIFNKLPIEPTTQDSQTQDSRENIAAPLLLPFVVLMASILITGAFSSGFDWLYPVRVVLSLLVLWNFRAYYKTVVRNLTGRSLLIGAIVFLFWIALVPVSTEKDMAFADSLADSVWLVQSAWLFFRFFGAAITIPVIEELVFRGYLLAKLVNQDFEKVNPGQFTWLSFFVSSLLFGALHGDWLAGTLAGMAYALALYHRGAVSDAITAHMTTNVMLAFYIMATGHWSLW